MAAHRRDLSKEPPLMAMTPMDYPNQAKCMYPLMRDACNSAWCPKHRPEGYSLIAKHIGDWEDSE